MIKLGCNDSLPIGWEWVKAQDCMDVRDGTHDSPKAQESGVPLVTSKNLVNGEVDFSTCTYISRADHDAISKRSKVDRGDILYAMIGTIGNPVIVDTDFEFSIKNVALFKFPDKSISNRFIYHYLNSSLATQQFATNSRGGTQKFVSLGNIRSLEIPLPPLAEQKRIAAILDKADAIRRKRQQAIQLADDFLRAVFLDMFGDPVTNPKGWEVKCLNDIIKEDTIITYGIVQAGPHLDKGVPYIRTGDFKNGRLAKDGYAKTSPEIASKFKRSEVRMGDLVYCIRASIGSVDIVPEYLDGANLTQGTARISPSNEVIAEYLVEFLRSQGFKTWIDQNSKGATFKEITLGKLREAPVYLPPFDLQSRFVAIKKVVENNLKNFSGWQEFPIFESLSQKAFRGEL